MISDLIRNYTHTLKFPSSYSVKINDRSNEAKKKVVTSKNNKFKPETIITIIVSTCITLIVSGALTFVGFSFLKMQDSIESLERTSISNTTIIREVLIPESNLIRETREDVRELKIRVETLLTTIESRTLGE